MIMFLRVGEGGCNSLFLCVELQCKCYSLTPAEEQLLQGLQAEKKRRKNSSTNPPPSLITRGFQQKTPLFNNLCLCVVVLALGTFGFLIYKAEDPASETRVFTETDVTR